MGYLNIPEDIINKIFSEYRLIPWLSKPISQMCLNSEVYDKERSKHLMYPLFMKEMNLDSNRIYPILNLGDKEGFTGYIDFLTHDDMKYDVMIGKDKYKREFIALKLKGTVNDVMVIFKRYEDSNVVYNNVGRHYFGSAVMCSSYWKIVENLINIGKHTFNYFDDNDISSYELYST